MFVSLSKCRTAQRAKLQLIEELILLAFERNDINRIPSMYMYMYNAIPLSYTHLHIYLHAHTNLHTHTHTHTHLQTGLVTWLAGSVHTTEVECTRGKVGPG